MSTTVGPTTFTTTVVDANEGSSFWTNPSYATAADGNYATITLGGYTSANDLRFALADIGVPSNAWITDFTLQVTVQQSQDQGAHTHLDLRFSSSNSGFFDGPNPMAWTNLDASVNTDQTITLSFNVIYLDTYRNGAVWNTGFLSLGLSVWGVTATTYSIGSAAMTVTYNTHDATNLTVHNTFMLMGHGD